MSSSRNTRAPREYKNPNHERTGYEKPEMSYQDRFAGQPGTHIQKAPPRTRHAVENPRYRPDYSDRRNTRRQEIWNELSFNARYRCWTSYSGIVGWYLHPHLAEDWADRKYRCYRRIYHGPRQRTGANERRRAEKRAIYEKIKNGKISTDSVLTKAEQGKIKAYLGREKDEIKAEVEAEAVRAKAKTEAAATITTLVPTIQPEIARILQDLAAQPKVQAQAQEAFQQATTPPENGFDFAAWRETQQWEERRREVREHNRELEKELQRGQANANSEDYEALWVKPEDQFTYTSEQYVPGRHD